MRFILNFIFFGVLFYLIWLFFPDAFKTLVSWADQIVAFFKEVFNSFYDKVYHHTPTSPTSPVPPTNPSHAFIMLPLFLEYFKGIKL